MESESFEPRIVVPDDDDWATVVAALVDYQCGILARLRSLGPVTEIPSVTREVIRASELLTILHAQAEADAARKEFGEVPDDLWKLDGRIDP
jgi:hypothetical protein